MVVVGKVSKGTVILPPGADLPEGSSVEVRPLPADEHSAGLAGAVADLTDELVRLSAKTQGMPPDLAQQHDHYLHGQPKR